MLSMCLTLTPSIAYATVWGEKSAGVFRVELMEKKCANNSALSSHLITQPISVSAQRFEGIFEKYFLSLKIFTTMGTRKNLVSHITVKS